jgi:hypothetical protein
VIDRSFLSVHQRNVSRRMVVFSGLASYEYPLFFLHLFKQTIDKAIGRLDRTPSTSACYQLRTKLLDCRQFANT